MLKSLISNVILFAFNLHIFTLNILNISRLLIMPNTMWMLCNSCQHMKNSSFALWNFLKIFFWWIFSFPSWLNLEMWNLKTWKASLVGAQWMFVEWINDVWMWNGWHYAKTCNTAAGIKYINIIHCSDVSKFKII